MKTKYQFRIKDYRGEYQEHLITIEAPDQFTAMNMINNMYPRSEGYSHSLIFNDEVRG